MCCDLQPYPVEPDMPKIIALTGKPGSGKDTLADHLVKHHGFRKLSFAEPVYRGVEAMNPWIVEMEMPLLDVLNNLRIDYGLSPSEAWRRAKDNIPECRRWLQVYGTEGGRDIHGEDCWINVLLGRIREGASPVVISDLRFPNEAEALRNQGAHLYRIHRPGHNVVNEHASERYYEAIAVDYVINNVFPSGPTFAVAAAGLLRSHYGWLV